MSNKRGGGLLFGVIMGTLLGVLFAPRKGKELRSQLKKEVAKGGVGAETLKKNFSEMGQDMASTAEEVYNMPEVQTQVKKGKKHVDRMVREAGEHIGNAEEKVKETVKDLGEKYLDMDEEDLQNVTGKIHEAGKKVGSKLQTFRKKYIGDFGFTKKSIGKKSSGGAKDSAKSASKKSPKNRTKKVKIQKKK